MDRTETASTKHLSRRVLVEVTRDTMTKTARVVWQHEIPILEAIFGEGNIKSVVATTMDEGYSAKASPELLPFNKKQDQIPPPSETVGIGYVFSGDAESEYNRLVGVYGRHPTVAISNAEHVYGRFQGGRFAQMLGQAEVEDLPDAQIRDLARAYGYVPDIVKDSTEAEKKSAKEKAANLASLKHDGLVKLANEIGVQLA